MRLWFSVRECHMHLPKSPLELRPYLGLSAHRPFICLLPGWKVKRSPVPIQPECCRAGRRYAQTAVCYRGLYTGEIGLDLDINLGIPV
jgi:hypothetical protein